MFRPRITSLCHDVCDTLMSRFSALADRVSFPRRGRSLFIESAVHDLVKGISAFWTDKNIDSVGDQICKAFLMVCAFALITNDQ
jgi:hypothetical protein